MRSVASIVACLRRIDVASPHYELLVVVVAPDSLFVQAVTRKSPVVSCLFYLSLCIHVRRTCALIYLHVVVKVLDACKKIETVHWCLLLAMITYTWPMTDAWFQMFFSRAQPKFWRDNVYRELYSLISFAITLTWLLQKLHWTMILLCSNRFKFSWFR